jgi:F-type H+-transporting ATPase subunit b
MAEQAHQSGTEAPGGQHGAFPPFNAHTFPSQIVWLVISFVLLYALMAKWALPQVAGVVEGRQKGIANDLAEADKLKRQSEEAVNAYEKALAAPGQQAVANAVADVLKD